MLKLPSSAPCLDEKKVKIDILPDKLKVTGYAENHKQENTKPLEQKYWIESNGQKIHKDTGKELGVYKIYFEHYPSVEKKIVIKTQRL